MATMDKVVHICQEETSRYAIKERFLLSQKIIRTSQLQDAQAAKQEAASENSGMEVIIKAMILLVS